MIRLHFNVKKLRQAFEVYRHLHEGMQNMLTWRVFAEPVTNCLLHNTGYVVLVDYLLHWLCLLIDFTSFNQD